MAQYYSSYFNVPHTLFETKGVLKYFDRFVFFVDARERKTASKR